MHFAEEIRHSLELSSGQTVDNFHAEGTCAGEHCPVHNPSDHPFVDNPLMFDGKHMLRLISLHEAVENGPGHYAMIERPVSVTAPSDGVMSTILVVLDPDDYVFNITGQAILRNSGQCKACGTYITSYHRHDMQTCRCGESFVDGGFDYLRRGGELVDTSVIYTK